MEQYEIGTYTFQPRNKFGRWMKKQTQVSSRFLVPISLAVSFASFCVAAVAISEAKSAREEMLVSQKEQLINIGFAENMMVSRFGRMIQEKNRADSETWTKMLEALNLTTDMAGEAQKMVAKSK